MALGLTQPVTEMSTRNISWRGKGRRCTGLTTLPPSCADCLEIWEPQPPGTLTACPGLYRDWFTFTFLRCIRRCVSTGDMLLAQLLPLNADSVESAELFLA
jgi:hypothetical protein